RRLRRRLNADADRRGDHHHQIRVGVAATQLDLDAMHSLVLTPLTAPPSGATRGPLSPPRTWRLVLGSSPRTASSNIGRMEFKSHPTYKPIQLRTRRSPQENRPPP